MPSSHTLSPALLQAILAQYSQKPGGMHGVPHWARVLENGRRLAALSGARLEVVELFAVFHDSRRTNEGFDPGHGRRGAELARRMRGQFFQLDDAGLMLLLQACADHTCGWTRADPTVQACWDADRLDLGRVGTTPRPERLCTAAARQPEVIAWAESRARRRALPELIRDEWEIILGTV